MTGTKANTAPWWKYPMVWLVIAGPTIVVIASFVTLGLALKYPDPPLETTPSSPHVSAEDASEGTAAPGSQTKR